MNTAFPGAVSAINLADCALRGVSYIPPADETKLHTFGNMSKKAVVAAIQERLAELDRRGAVYCLIWCVGGDEVDHINCSDDRVHREELAHFLSHGIAGYFRH